MIRIAGALGLALIVAAAPARADTRAAGARTPPPPYKPGHPDKNAVDAAEDANLEPEAGRSGMVFGIALGPALQIGVNVNEHATGTGGAFSFRLGRVASRDTIILFEICGTVFPYRFTDSAMVHHTQINQSAMLAVGAQTYVKRTVWLRAGVGFATSVSRAEGETMKRTVNHYGGGSVLGLGVDIGRWKSAALGLELLATGALYRDGAIIGGGLVLGLTFY